MRSFLAALAVLLAYATPAAAQDLPLLVPSQSDLAIDALTFEDQTFEALVGAGEAGQSVGQITQRVSQDGSYVTIVTEADVPQFRQAGTDSVRVLRASLAPQTVAYQNPNGETAQVRFDALRAIGSYGPEGRTLPIDLELKTPAFHAGQTAVSGGAALVARALPFEAGYAGRIQTFSPTQRLREATLTVAGREDAERLDGTTVSAWVVEERPEGSDDVARRYFVDPETRDLLQVVSTPQPGTTVVVRPADPDALAAAAAAQAALPRLQPGADGLDPSRIQTGTRVSTLRLVQPMQQDVGTQTERVTVDEAAGTLTVVSLVEVPMQGLALTDSTVVDLATLRPLSEVVDAGDSFQAALTYGEGGVTGTAGSEEVDVALDTPVFAASTVAAVVQALPLADGYQVVLPTFAAGGALSSASGVTPVTVEVTGPADVDGRSAWTVVATPEGAPATTFTLDAETREILMTQIQPQPGVVIDVVPQD